MRFVNRTNRKNKATSHYFNNIVSISNFSTLLFLLPSLLIIPILYYSLNTPFALVDDLGMCYYVEFLDNSKRFFKWFDQQFLSFGYGRYRPFFDFYNMVTWSVFGPTPWMHHASRWILHFSSVIAFSSAFLYFTAWKSTKAIEDSNEEKTSIPLLPLAFLAYIWLFFPNSPASRLGPQEILSVFFLGLCNWAIADIICWAEKKDRFLLTCLSYTTLYIGYLGLSLSKEINIAVMLWILVFYCALQIKLFRWKKMLRISPLIVIFFYSLVKIYVASTRGSYGISPITMELVLNNSIWIFKELFQVNTSIVITAVFSLFSTLLLLRTCIKTIQGKFSKDLIFVLFLIGQFITMYLILCTSWAQVLRYYYILIPVFSTLMAFAVKYLLDFGGKDFRILTNALSSSIVVFLLFFISCNYFNVLQQTIVQHSLRNAESRLITEITNLHDQSEHVQILKIKGDPEVELVNHLILYYRRFSPRFLNEKYKIYTGPPHEKNTKYYVVTMHSQPETLETYKTILNRQEYTLLTLSAKVSGFFQGKRPYLSKDAGVHLLNGYRWIIYRATT